MRVVDRSGWRACFTIPWASLASLCLVGCGGSCQSTASESRAESEPAGDVAPAASARLRFPAEATRLLSVHGSAFTANLVATEDTSYLLTPGVVYRLSPEKPAERWVYDFGSTPALVSGHLLYWARGALWKVPTSGGAPTNLAAVARQPRRLVTSGEHVAWLEPAQLGGVTIETLVDAAETRMVHAPSGDVTALAIEQERIYFVERAEDRSWRLGVVASSGGPARYTPPKRGRTPAMLVVADAVYYYDGPSSTLRQVSPDLEDEQILARGVICSPLAVAEHVYCAQPAGLLEIAISGGVRRRFPIDDGGSITELTATTGQLVWLSDIGGQRLAVDSLPLAAPASGEP